MGTLTKLQRVALRIAALNGIVAGGFNRYNQNGGVYRLAPAVCPSLEKRGLLEGYIGNDGDRWYKLTNAGAIVAARVADEHAKDEERGLGYMQGRGGIK